MVTLRTDSDGELWFFTGAETAKTEEIRANAHVNVSYSSPRDNRYVSVSGMAAVVHDHQRVKALLSQLDEGWFPQGPDDPDLALLRVEVERAEYWDAPAGTMAEINGLWDVALTCEPPAVTENEKFDLKGSGGAKSWPV